MNQEQPEVPPSADALLDGYEGRTHCTACDVEAAVSRGEPAPEVRHPLYHSCKEKSDRIARTQPEGVTVGQSLEAWALAGQPGAPQGQPCVPPGTTLAR
jgi:hypothetical protein